MGSKADPVHAVLDYFEETELALAEQTFAIVRRILRRRQPSGAGAKKKAAGTPKAVRATAPVVSQVG
jgi:hypothetical protein